jgi:hypothetical protein
MNKHKRVIIILAVLLLITGGNYWRISSGGNVRTVEFLSIFVLGALFGLLVSQYVALLKKE